MEKKCLMGDGRRLDTPLRPVSTRRCLFCVSLIKNQPRILSEAQLIISEDRFNYDYQQRTFELCAGYVWISDGYHMNCHLGHS